MKISGEPAFSDNAGQLLDVERLYAALVAVSLLGFGLSVLVDVLERVALPLARCSPRGTLSRSAVSQRGANPGLVRPACGRIIAL